MDWNNLISARRYGLEQATYENKETERTQFQRDYDRLIFSSAFRRLQDKTQIFPLPGSVFVHNRLTHSLEVASVGRSLGTIIGTKLKATDLIDDKEITSEFGSIVSAACLAHDLGNPPFGHNGEAAISKYFKEGPGQQFQYLLQEEEWMDVANFEGNANTLRILTHQFKGRREGGFALTYSTLASIVKYPYPSIHKRDTNKYGFFKTERPSFEKIAQTLQLKKYGNGVYCRHPLVYLVEAADDICYLIMDIEDAHKLKILTYEETKDLLLAFFDKERDQKTWRYIERNLNTVVDTNEQITFLRAKVIGKLVQECSEVFWQNHQLILQGQYTTTLTNDLRDNSYKAMKYCKELSLEKIYRHRSVIEIEISGYKILGTLLEEFINAVLNPKTSYARLLLAIIPKQYNVNENSPYLKILSVLDFISGMTDIYALKLYRKIQGMDLSKL